MSSKAERKQLLVTQDVQIPMVMRTLMYWAACLLFLLLPLSFARTYQNPERLLFQHLADICVEYWPILLTACLLLPLAMYDMLKFSHRVAGPLFRLHREMKRLARGDEHVSHVTWRPRDFWHELATAFNDVADRVQQQVEEKLNNQQVAVESEAEPQAVLTASESV